MLRVTHELRETETAEGAPAVRPEQRVELDGVDISSWVQRADLCVLPNEAAVRLHIIPQKVVVETMDNAELRTVLWGKVYRLVPVED